MFSSLIKMRPVTGCATQESRQTESETLPPGRDRLRLFRNGRLATAAVALIAFPALTVSEPWQITAALLLSGLLPAAIALDCREPDGLDRASGMALVAAAAVLAGATLVGLPVALAFAFIAIQALEAQVVSGRLARSFAVASCTLVSLSAAGLAASSAAAHAMPAAVTVIVAMLTVNAGMLVRGLVISQANQERRASADRMRAGEIEAVMAEAIIVADQSGAVIRISGNTDRILGLPAEALTGRGLTEMVLVADRPELLTALCACAHGEEPRKLRARMRGSLDGAVPRYRSVEVSIIPGEGGVALASLRDVSELVAAEDAHATLVSEGESASRARAAFLSTVNHELRTPLNAIIGFSDIIANPATTPANQERLREYARLINGAGQDLLRIISAMIDITRLDSGVYDFDAEPMDLEAAVLNAVDAFRQEPEGASAEIEVAPAAESLDALIDRRAFRAVMHQLLSNAVKFGGPHAIEVRTGVEENWAVVTIVDHGPGMPADKLAQVGRNFARADEGLTRTHGGVGLGLSLAGGLMALHGGEIRLESAPGEGTSVTLRLPRAPATPNNVRTLPARAQRQAQRAAGAPRSETRRRA
jgi:cell cycle sensor histidine kinase DivJ